MKSTYLKSYTDSAPDMTVVRKFLNWYARLSPAYGNVKPPYKHVVQIGDPRLRKVSEPVPLDKIKTDEIQSVIEKLEYVLKKFGSVGMSAPQIGVNMRIFVMRISERQVDLLSKEIAKSKVMSVVPYTVFINPNLKVIDYQKVTHLEGCESVRGFIADVPRFKEVEVSGYNQHSEQIARVFQGWAARVAQHELDHLNGKMYTDVMDRKSLQCSCWQDVNLSQGKLSIPFTP